ncbi:hypothetical protein [Acidovorax facilis]|uniref:hypothetical protein n=1 Tax=Acidovorax facilis TaxID=12917 RepID=UPI003D64D131
MESVSNYQAYKDAIKKTGFVLENRVAQLLKASGWTVISNKYYEDDYSNTVREVDLIAYKVSHVQHFDVYTTLVISCKKSEENVWALLARDINLKDPNADWWPMHAWSNDPALQYRLAEPNCAKAYHAAAQSFGVVQALSVPDVEVFAFQELSKAAEITSVTRKQTHGSGSTKLASSPKNDVAIFSAITSLMKAQAYELGSLPNRKKKPSLYQFNLLAVADTELLRLHFRGSDIECAEIDSEHYVGRYIIHRKETFSRIRFIRASAFESTLQDYGRLHDANAKWVADECDSFYRDIVQDDRRLNALLPTFRNEVRSFIRWKSVSEAGVHVDMETATLSYSKKEKKLLIHTDFGLEIDAPDKFNQSKAIKERVSKALEKVYRYEGAFEFIDDIPF